MIRGTVHRELDQERQQHKLYELIAFPGLTCERETWTMTKNDERGTEATVK